jgi:hypothetical protein
LETSLGFGPNETEGSVLVSSLATASISSMKRWTEKRGYAQGEWRARRPSRVGRSGIVQQEGRHALNVEIEVRVLVPELAGE